jgi:cytoskeletal protein RodZ
MFNKGDGFLVVVFGILGLIGLIVWVMIVAAAIALAGDILSLWDVVDFL